MPKFIFETKTRVEAHKHICLHCGESFNINDKDSEHQVNDALGGVTFCSTDCSQGHMFCAEGFPLLVETHKNATLLEINQSINDEIVGDSEKELLSPNLAQSVYDAVQTKEETL